MKKNILFLCASAAILTACHSSQPATEYVEYADDMQYQTVFVPDSSVPYAPGTSQIKYSVPRDGDLTLETRHHVIQIQGAPGTQYSYQVWAGDKTYADDPDLVVEDGNIMVLREDN